MRRAKLSRDLSRAFVGSGLGGLGAQALELRFFRGLYMG